jgi:cell division protein FtsL
MNRLSIICLWFMVIVVCAFGVYRMKYEVQFIRTQIVETTQELAQEKESLHVVAAEWAYLNRPERLQQLADKYLTNAQLTVAQVAEVEAIPFHQTQIAADMAGADDEARIVPIVYRKGGF